MSRLTAGILGAVALSLISGAAQLAFGGDFSPATPAQAQTGEPLSASAASTSTHAVNRGAKGDRAANGSSSAATRTVSLRFDGFADTTFLLRVPVAVAVPPAATTLAKPRRPMVACEPMVSVLAEAAKQLQPGRCVT
jgi:hypothetical protein